MSIEHVPELFTPATRSWFGRTFDTPTPTQLGAWSAAAGGKHALVIAPTGSGKTLAAFLHAIDDLLTAPAPAEPNLRCRVLYVSPLKALAVDVQRNLHAPLAGITAEAAARGVDVHPVDVGTRTGDTPAAQRRRFVQTPPDILVTTPESLFLLLTSQARESLRGVRTVIVDEVHAVAATKRGAHLALSLERLDALLPQPAQRIGLSATVRPVDEVARFLAGGRPVDVVQPQVAKSVQVSVQVPVEDMTNLPILESDRGPVDQPAEFGPQEDVDGAPIQRPSIWPSVERRILELIHQHRSTIVFCNSRRIAERLTARLNELAADEPAVVDRFPAASPAQSGITAGVGDRVVAMAHHGSMSHTQRTTVETRLKEGALPCVVATSSLELGIDMGAVDLVVQVEPPPTVASGLQRVGRAGHHVGAVSTGILFPKLRGELAAAAVTAERMTDRAIEEIAYPRNPLDVLAQHIVAITAVDDVTVDELGQLVRGAAPFATLSDGPLHGVLDMLAGRYPSADFAELRPRITWDRATGVLRGRPGSQRLAATSGGTIPDRGLYSVVLASDVTATGGRRVGELDEEMVHESRVGDTILLGTSSWKITDITHDRVVVAPAPGQAARMPFWKGDTVGRPLELGRAIGSFVRELTTTDEPAARDRIARCGLDAWAADNLLGYLADQQAATARVPDDRTIVIERFRDALGDWRAVVHSPFGARVNAPWALLIAANLRDRRGIDANAMPADDGIVLRLPDADVAPITVDDILVDPDSVEHALADELSASTLFASRFRECAARSLLLPRRDPRRRSPLWQQRLRSAHLFSVAADYPEFPVMLEAMRECLQDVYDVGGLRTVLAELAAHTIDVVEVETPAASPFARSMLLEYVGLFLYGDDTPLAERRSAALALDSSLLAELLGSESLRELLDPDVVAEIEAALQHTDGQQPARDVEDAADLLRRLGDLSHDEARQRGVRSEWLTQLVDEGRALSVPIAGQERYIAIEDAARVRDGLAVTLPRGVPEAFTTPVTAPLRDLLARYARRHGPFSAPHVADRYGLVHGAVVAVLDELTAAGTLARGELDPRVAAGGDEYCDAEVLRRIRRTCLARTRAAIEPVEQHTLAAFLPAWHGIGDTANATAEDVLAVVEQLAGAVLPASAVESLVLPSRVAGYTPALLDELTTAGDVVWCGCGGLPGGDGWVALAPADSAALLLPDPAQQPPTGQLHAAVLEALGGGALFFRQLVDAVHQQVGVTSADADVVAALWDLVWAGLVTGDSLAGLRAHVAGSAATPRQRPRAVRGRRGRMRAARPAMPTMSGPPVAAGRWSLVIDREQDPTRRAHAHTEALLDRHGVLTRGALDTERVPGGYSAIYRVLREMTEQGTVVRAYAVAGLSGAQFAVPGAIDRLRAAAAPSEPAVLAAADPAQPFGAALPWPDPVGEAAHRPARKAGAVVVLCGSAPVLYLERGGKSVLSFTEDESTLQAAATALAARVSAGRLGPLTIRQADGTQALSSGLGTVLRRAGFRATPQGLRLRQ